MKKTIIIILIILNKINCFGLNIPKYHFQIIEAERLFLNNNFSESINLYYKIFKENKKYFAKDCYIAAQISLLNNDTSSFKKFSEYGFKKGIDWKMYLNDSLTNRFLDKYPLMKEELEITFNKMKKVYLMNINLPIRYEIEAIIKRDMLYHNMPGFVQEHYKWEKIYGKIMDENKLKVLDYFVKYGYLGENIIGIKNIKLDNNCNNLTYYNQELNEFTDLIFFHNEYCYFEARKYLIKALENGDIQPRLFAHYYEWAYSGIKAQTDTTEDEVTIVETGEKMKLRKTHILLKSKCIIPTQDKFYKIFKGDFNPIWGNIPNIIINNCREEIGICSTQHEAEKKSFEAKHNVKLFFGMFGEL